MAECARTSTDSVVCPTSSFTSGRLTVSLAGTLIWLCSSRLKPAASMASLYAPGCSDPKKNRPVSLVTALRSAPVAEFVSRIGTPVITASDGSITTPEMAPVIDCGNAGKPIKTPSRRIFMAGSYHYMRSLSVPEQCPAEATDIGAAAPARMTELLPDAEHIGAAMTQVHRQR